MRRQKKPEADSDLLKGWQQIAKFLVNQSRSRNAGQTQACQSKKGQYVVSSREELNKWFGRESAGEPVQIATEETNLRAELKRGLSFVRKQGARNQRRTPHN